MGPTDIKEAQYELSPETTASTSIAQDARATQSPSPTETTPALANRESLSRASTNPTPTYKVYKRRFFGLGQLALLNIIVSWDWISFAPVSKSSAQYFNRSESVINWLSTAFLFAFCVAAPVTIYTLNKSGPKASIITAACLLLVGNWVRYGGTRSSNFGVVMFGQILVGLAQPFVLSAPTRYSDLWFSERGRVSATAVASLANPFGGALGQLIDPFWVTNASDIPNMVLYVSIISSVACVPSFFIPSAPPTPASASASRSLHHRPLNIRTTLSNLSRSVEFWLIFLPFAVYVGLFNSISSLLNQMLEPYGYSETQAGIAGAILILVGLVFAAISSPLIDRYKFYLIFIKLAVPIIALSYLVFIWAPSNNSIVYAYVVCGVLGAASFGLVPVALEYLVEIHHPLGPEVGSTLSWTGGQLLGGIFIIIQSALKAGKTAQPPYNLRKALIFQAVVGMVIMPLPLCLNLFGRKVKSKRLEIDKMAGTGSRDGSADAVVGS
jgi:MFS family permease